MYIKNSKDYKEEFLYLTTFFYGYMTSDIWKRITQTARNPAAATTWATHSIKSKNSLICTIPQLINIIFKTYYKAIQPGLALGGAGPNWEQFQSAQVPSQLAQMSVFVCNTQAVLLQVYICKSVTWTFSVWFFIIKLLLLLLILLLLYIYCFCLCSHIKQNYMKISTYIKINTLLSRSHG